MIRLFNVYYPTRTVALVVWEAFLICTCFLLATLFVLGPDAYISLAYEQGFFKIGAIVLVSIMLSYYFDLYEEQVVTVPLEIYFRILLVLAIDCFIVSGLLAIFPELSHNRGIYITGFAFLTPSMILARRAYVWLTQCRVFQERVYVLGSHDLAHEMSRRLEKRRDIGMNVVGFKDLPLGDGAKELWLDALHEISTLKPAVRRVFLALDETTNDVPVKEELLGLRFRGMAIERADSLYERLYGKISLDFIHPTSLLCSDGFQSRPAQQFMRQFLSMLAAAIGLVLFLPMFPFVVLAVRLSSKGPIFFRQTRVGLTGRHFQVIKFRTMHTDAEAGGARWATKNDPRVTRVGMWMRKTRIDEIPQLWNVLRGDMNFVGPRPERPEFIPMLAENLPYYSLRHLVRPGLTGWAQVRYGYGATLAECREKLEYDLYYIKHMSVGLDLVIMFETVKTILRRRGAQ